MSDEPQSADSGPAPRARRARVSWRAQMILLWFVLLVSVVSVAVGGALYESRRAAEDQAARRALAIARTMAQDPRYAAWVVSTDPSPNGPVQLAAEQVRDANDALYVVVTDTSGIRFSHTNPDNVGEQVSTDPGPALAGREVTLIQTGTLGVSARAKIPLRDMDGDIVGAISIGVPIAEVDATTARASSALLGGGVIALGGGLLGLWGLWLRLRESTHGLDPEQMADLLREHAAVLSGALDGILAVDPQGRIRVYNEAARRYLGLEVAIGTPVARSGLPAPIVGLLTLPHAPRRRRKQAAVLPATLAQLVVLDNRILSVRRSPVRHDGRDLGAVVVLRDRTDLDELARELDATRALTDALRAQNHEHKNRLHALSGMLELGGSAAASEYLEQLTRDTAWNEQLADPFLAGLIAAKRAVASEQGVELVISHESWIDRRLDSPLDATTVVGNLLDNAIRAAAEGGRRPRRVEVTLLADGTDLICYVIDSGDGVAPADVERLFRSGWTTKDEEPGAHGVGLALSRATARRHGGDLELVEAAGDGHGAAFRALLRDVFPRDKEDG